MDNLPWFRSISWYFLVTSNYFFYGETLVEQFGVVINKVDFLPILVKYHRLISFSMYIMGFVWFVLSLVKKYYLRQFSLFAWTHVALLCVVTQSYLIIQNMFQGLIWFIMPIMISIDRLMTPPSNPKTSTPPTHIPHGFRSMSLFDSRASTIHTSKRTALFRYWSDLALQWASKGFSEAAPR